MRQNTKMLSKFFLSSFIKSKRKSCKFSLGRNHKGYITAWHRGGGHKQLYRHIDLYRQSTNGIVVGLEYDPNRLAFLARVYNPDTLDHQYILAAEGLKKGDVIRSNSSKGEKGHSQKLKYVLPGSQIYNLSLKPGKKGQILRSPGMFGKLLRKTTKYGKIKLKSGLIKWFDANTMASLGVVSNENIRFYNKQKAGKNRQCGIRPTVRGVAMNPIDHPHGGGEGKTSGGRPAVTPWGKPAKGKKTRRFRTQLQTNVKI